MNELEASAQLPAEHPADPMTSDQGSTGSAAELQLNANTITGKATLNPNADVFQVKNVQAAPLVDQPLEGAPLEEAAVEGAGVPLANGDVIGGVEDDGGVEALVDPQGSYQENGPAPAPLPMAPLPSLVSDNLDLVPPPATALTQDAAPPGPLAAPPGPLAAPPGPLAAPPGTMAAPPGTLAAPLAAPPGTLAAPSVSAGEEVLEGAAAPTLAIGGAEAANPAPTDASAEAQTNALKTKISDQIDYYFCQENLEKDDYMWSQMDHEHYIPIATIANFHRLQQLTTNTELIKQVLQENKSVQVDEKVEKVRPVACSRIQIMLREIPKVVGEEQVQSLFDNPACPTVVSAKRDINETWFITFANESDCSRAYQYLMSEVRTFMDKPIRARIKSKVLNRNPSYQRNGYSSHRMPGEGVYAPSYAPTMPSVQPRLPIFSNTQPEGYYMDHTQPAVYPDDQVMVGFTDDGTKVQTRIADLQIQLYKMCKQLSDAGTDRRMLRGMKRWQSQMENIASIYRCLLWQEKMETNRTPEGGQQEEVFERGLEIYGVEVTTEGQGTEEDTEGQGTETGTEEATEGLSNEVTAEGQGTEEATEGLSNEVTAEGQGTEEATEGLSNEVTAEGQGTEEAIEGLSNEVNAEGQGTEEATEGLSNEVTTEGQGTEEATEGLSNEVTAEGQGTEEAIEGLSNEVTAEGQGTEEATEGLSNEVTTEGQGTEEATEGLSNEVTAEGQGTEEATEGLSNEVTAEGQGTEEATEGLSNEVTAEGQGTEEAIEGLSNEVTAEGQGTEEATEGLSNEVTTEGQGFEEVTEGQGFEEATGSQGFEEATGGLINVPSLQWTLKEITETGMHIYEWTLVQEGEGEPELSELEMVLTMMTHYGDGLKDLCCCINSLYENVVGSLQTQRKRLIEQIEAHRHDIECNMGRIAELKCAEDAQIGMPEMKFQAALYGNLPSQILATWPQPPTAPTPQPAYLDPGQMLNLNGYQPASIRTTPGNRHVQNYGNSRNSRNTNRQHRGGSHLERSNSESRTLGERGPTVTGGGGSRTSPRSLDGAPISTSTSLAHSFQGRGPRNSDPGHPTPLHPPQPLAHTGSGAGDSAPRGGSQADNSGGSHSRRNNFGRRRRDGNDSRNSQRQQAQNARETRLEQQFDLESNSFPPLPCTGEKNNQSLSDMHENKKSHSDVVRGGMGRSQQRGSSSSEPRLSAGPTASPAPSVSTHTPHATAHPPSQHSREAPEPTAVPVSHAASAPVTAEPAHHKAKTSHHVESKPVAEPAASTPAPAVATVSAQNVQSKPAPEPAKISYAQMLKRNNAAGQSATPQEAAPAATTSATTTTTTTAAPAAKASANAEETQASASAASVVNSGRPGPRDQNHRINSPANHRGGMNGPRRDDQRDPRYGRPFSGSHGSGRGGRGRRSQTK